MAGLGFGNFVKPQATSVRPGDLPTFKDLNTQDKLLMLSAALRGDSQTAMQIPMMAAARQKQADEREWRGGLAEELRGAKVQRQIPIMNDEGEDISAGFAPSMETTRGPRPTLRDLVPKLMEGIDRGYNVGPIVDLLDKTGPKIKYEGGLPYDESDPSTAPKFIPKLGEGERVLYDENQNPFIVNIDGKVKAVADIERAKAEATEGVKANYDVGVYEDANGIPRRMTRAQAAAVVGGGTAAGGAGAPGGGVVPAVTARSGIPDISRGQSAAERERDIGRAKTDVEVEALTPKARSTMDVLNRKSDFILEALKKARGQVKDGFLGSGVGGTAGLNDLTKFIPGTESRNLDATLDTLRANLGFGELADMRQNSPTGGAVGSLTERELNLLSSLTGSLDQGQGSEQLRGNIDRMIKELETITKERRAAFQRQYGVGSTPAGRKAAAGRITPEQARAELERRRAAAGAR